MAHSIVIAAILFCSIAQPGSALIARPHSHAKTSPKTSPKSKSKDPWQTKLKNSLKGHWPTNLNTTWAHGTLPGLFLLTAPDWARVEALCTSIQFVPKAVLAARELNWEQQLKEKFWVENGKNLVRKFNNWQNLLASTLGGFAKILVAHNFTEKVFGRYDNKVINFVKKEILGGPNISNQDAMELWEVAPEIIYEGSQQLASLTVAVNGAITCLRSSMMYLVTGDNSKEEKMTGYQAAAACGDMIWQAADMLLEGCELLARFEQGQVGRDYMEQYDADVREAASGFGGGSRR